MKKQMCAVILTVALVMACFNPITTQAYESRNDGINHIEIGEEKIYSTATLSDDFAEDSVIVVLTNAASLDSFNYGIADFSEVDCTDVINLSDAMATRVQAFLAGENIEEMFGNTDDNVVPQGFYDVDVTKFHQILLLKIAEGSKENVLAAIEILEQRIDVLYAGPDYIVSMDDDALCTTIPNDTYANAQWAIEKIDLLNAWDICLGDGSVTVGIIDTGIDGSHEELASRIDVAKSVVCNNNSQYSHVTSVTDPFIGHGTMVAGIIGACTNNQVGISGISWNVRMASLCAAEYGQTSSKRIIGALNAATAQNIPIVNISLKVNVNDSALLSAVENYNGLIICCACNDGVDLDNYPAYPAHYSTDNMIVVGASTVFDEPWALSNFGAQTVDLFAPGAMLVSCFPGALCGQTDYDLTDNLRPCEAYGMAHHDTGYHAANGTSLAAPHVAGVAALIMMEYPHLTVAEVKNRILNSVDIAIRMVGKCATGGRLNAYKALHNHALLWGDHYDAYYHVGYCSCGAHWYEAHTFINVGGMDYCSGCGYVLT